MSKEAFAAVVEMATLGTTDHLEGMLRAGDADRVRGEIVRIAHFHLVGGLVAAALANNRELDEPLTAHFAPFKRRLAVKHLRTMADVGWLRQQLDGADIPWAVLKGPFLVEHAYKRIDVRAYTDLDVLVDRHRFGEVLELLESSGARLTDRNWPLIADSARGEVSLVSPRGTLLDLHWHLLVDEKVRHGYRIDIDAVMARRRTIGSGDGQMPALAPDDAWFYTAMHAILTGGDRLLWGVDLERLLEADGDLTEGAWERAKRFGWAGPGAMGLDLVAEVFPHRRERANNAPNHPWRRMRQAALRNGGLNRSLDGRFSTSLLTKSVRRNAATSSVAFASALWGQSIRGPLINNDHPWRRQLKGLTPEVERPPSPLKVDVPDAAARRLFLRTISSAP